MYDAPRRARLTGPHRFREDHSTSEAGDEILHFIVGEFQRWLLRRSHQLTTQVPVFGKRHGNERT